MLSISYFISVRGFFHKGGWFLENETTRALSKSVLISSMYSFRRLKHIVIRGILWHLPISGTGIYLFLGFFNAWNMKFRLIFLQQFVAVNIWTFLQQMKARREILCVPEVDQSRQSLSVVVSRLSLYLLIDWNCSRNEYNGWNRWLPRVLSEHWKTQI